MTSRLLSLSLLIASTLTIGCMDGQSYTPIGEGEREDTFCTQADPDITVMDSVPVDLGFDESLSHSDSVEVTAFTKSTMRLNTKALVISPPKDSIVSIGVEAGDWTAFENMVFRLEMWRPDLEAWAGIELETSDGDISWYTDVEIDLKSKQMIASTMRRCSSVGKITSPTFPLPPLKTDTPDIRVMAYPFDVWGDLVGTHDYTLNISAQ
jgi:hypothetical protein